MRIGVASGLVCGSTAGVAGRPARQRGCGISPAEQVIIAANTALAGDLYAYRDLGSLAKGVVGPDAAAGAGQALSAALKASMPRR